MVHYQTLDPSVTGSSGFTMTPLHQKIKRGDIGRHCWQVRGLSPPHHDLATYLKKLSKMELSPPGRTSCLYLPLSGECPWAWKTDLILKAVSKARCLVHL